MENLIPGGPGKEWFWQFFTEFCQNRFPDAEISGQLIELLSENAEMQKLKKKEKLIGRGDSQTSLYFLHSGAFRCYTQKNDGKELTNNFITEHGEPFIAAATIKEGEPAVDTIQALEESVVVLVSLKLIDTAAMQYREVNDLFARALGASFQRYLKTIQMRSCSAEDRCRWMHKNYPELESRVQKQYIASYLDMDKAMYSRCMKAVLRQEREQE